MTCAYLRKAHTHEDLDGLFGQLTVTLANSAFSTMTELIDVLLRKLPNLGLHRGTRNMAYAYALDEVADWEGLTNCLDVKFAGHGGARAPHVFKFVARRDLGWELDQLRSAHARVPEVHDLPPHMARNPRDVFVITRHYMSSNSVLQVTVVSSFVQHGSRAANQPTSCRPSKVIPLSLRRELHAQCEQALQQRIVSQVCADFLTSWADGTLPKTPRPSRYNYLDRDVFDEQGGGAIDPLPHFDNVVRDPTLVQVVLGDRAHIDAREDAEAEADDTAPLDVRADGADR